MNYLYPFPEVVLSDMLAAAKNPDSEIDLEECYRYVINALNERHEKLKSYEKEDE